MSRKLKIYNGSEHRSLEEKQFREELNKKASKGQKDKLLNPDESEFIDNVARTYYYALVKDLIEILPINNLDFQVLCQYCNYLSIIYKATKELGQQPLLDANGKINPLFTMIRQATEENRKISNVLGINLSQRISVLKLAAEKEEKNELGDLKDIL